MAAKCALCIRCDALGESENAQIGAEAKQYVEKRLEFLNQNEQGGFVAKPQKKGAAQAKEVAVNYNSSSDFTNKFKKSGAIGGT